MTFSFICYSTCLCVTCANG